MSSRHQGAHRDAPTLQRLDCFLVDVLAPLRVVLPVLEVSPGHELVSVLLIEDPRLVEGSLAFLGLLVVHRELALLDALVDHRPAELLLVPPAPLRRKDPLLPCTPPRVVHEAVRVRRALSSR